MATGKQCRDTRGNVLLTHPMSIPKSHDSSPRFSIQGTRFKYSNRYKGRSRSNDSAMGIVHNLTTTYTRGRGDCNWYRWRHPSALLSTDILAHPCLFPRVRKRGFHRKSCTRRNTRPEAMKRPGATSGRLVDLFLRSSEAYFLARRLEPTALCGKKRRSQNKIKPLFRKQAVCKCFAILSLPR